MSTVSVYARVDIDEVLDELTNEQLADELQRRGIETALEVQEKIDMSFTPLIEEALEDLRRDRIDDAILVLERALYPKYTSQKAVEALFAKLKASVA